MTLIFQEGRNLRQGMESSGIVHTAWDTFSPHWSIFPFLIISSMSNTVFYSVLDFAASVIWRFSACSIPPHPFDIVVWKTTAFSSTISDAALTGQQSQVPDWSAFLKFPRTSFYVMERSPPSVKSLSIKFTKNKAVNLKKTMWLGTFEKPPLS